MIQLAAVNLYDLAVNILRVNDQVRDSKTAFDKFIYSICSNVAEQCQQFCAIDDELCTMYPCI